jgi:hypothetical protein
MEGLRPIFRSVPPLVGSSTKYRPPFCSGWVVLPADVDNGSFEAQVRTVVMMWVVDDVAAAQLGDLTPPAAGLQVEFDQHPSDRSGEGVP